MIRVGLTGGIASGKSEVARRLAARGAVVIDADVLAREAVAAGTAGLAEVVAAFGPAVLRADGQLDRAALGRAVFADPAKRDVLEGIVHPRVRARAAALERAAVEADPGAVVVHDIPLLVETRQASRFDAVVVVDAPDEVRLARLVSDRAMTAQDAAARIAAQAARDERLRAATWVVDNSGTLNRLDAEVDRVWAAISAAAARPDRVTERADLP